MAVEIDIAKQVFMIGGPNGAGKTTCAFSLMPELLLCDEYVNADSIAASLSPFKPESTAIQAGKLMLRRIDELLKHNVNFAFESTMASKAFSRVLANCKQQGYQINLLYVWLVSPELAVERVNSRVRKGGHDIPDATIRRRYFRSMYNLMNLYIPLADRWRLIDNSEVTENIIAEKYMRESTINIIDETSWTLFKEISL